MKRNGVIKSDDTAYSYVFVNGQCYVTIFNTEPGRLLVSWQVL